METTILEQDQNVNQKIQLVKGKFTPNEASEIIMSFIDKKINFHKLQRLQIWENCHATKTKAIDARIKELEQEKEIARNVINQSREQGLNLSINSTLDINISN